MRDTSQYGSYYWCAKVTKDLSPDGEIYVMADEVNVEDGVLLFLRHKKEPVESREPNLIIPALKWTAVFAASVMDGHAVAVDHWAGEIVEPGDHDAAKQGAQYRSKKRLNSAE